MKKIKVLHFLSRLDVGGMENGVVNICNRLDRSKFELMICCLKGLGAMVDRLESDVKVFNLKFPEGRDLLRPFAVAHFLRKIQPDIVHTHGWAQGSFESILGARLAQVPVVLNGEHGGFHLKKHQIFLQILLSFFCDLTLTVSQSLKDEIVKNIGINPKTIFVIRNGVDVEKFNGEHDTASLVDEIKTKVGEDFYRIGSFILGCVGSLKPEKNQILLLRAVKQINYLFPENNIIVLFIGDGPDRNRLEDYVYNNKLGKQVVFMGTRNNIPQVFSLLDVLVSTSVPYWEGLSNVMLEAMSSGVPVIATRSIGSIELIEDAVNGFIIESNDITNLINKIISMNKKPEIAIEMSREASILIKNKFSINEMVSGYENCYLSRFESFKRKGKKNEF